MLVVVGRQDSDSGETASTNLSKSTRPTKCLDIRCEFLNESEASDALSSVYGFVELSDEQEPALRLLNTFVRPYLKNYAMSINHPLDLHASRSKHSHLPMIHVQTIAHRECPSRPRYATSPPRPYLMSAVSLDKTIIDL